LAAVDDLEMLASFCPLKLLGSETL